MAYIYIGKVRTLIVQLYRVRSPVAQSIELEKVRICARWRHFCWRDRRLINSRTIF